MPRINYVLNFECLKNPLLIQMYLMEETYDPVILEDIKSRTDKVSLRPFTYAAMMKPQRSNRLLLYVSFENPQSNSALIHLWLPSYYGKYA
jgi:hypothetical protein